MTGARDITQLFFFSSILAGIMTSKIEQSFYSVYSYSGIQSIERALRLYSLIDKCVTVASLSGERRLPKVQPSTCPIGLHQFWSGQQVTTCGCTPPLVRF